MGQGNSSSTRRFKLLSFHFLMPVIICHFAPCYYLLLPRANHMLQLFSPIATPVLLYPHLTTVTFPHHLSPYASIPSPLTPLLPFPVLPIVLYYPGFLYETQFTLDHNPNRSAAANMDEPFHVDLPRLHVAQQLFAGTTYHDGHMILSF